MYFFPFILWTSSSLDVPAGVTQEEYHTGFLIHLLSAVRGLIFLARRIQPFLSLVDREVEFCVLTILIVLHPLGIFFFFFFFFLVRKIPFAGIELTSQRVRGLRGTSELPGRPVIGCKEKTSSWHSIGFPDGSNIGSSVYHIGERPTVILYTYYINRHAGTPSIISGRDPP